MFLTKLKVVVGAVLVVVALGAGGVAYRSADAQTVQPAQKAKGKPLSEVEALRRQNELLQLNLEVVLEKVRSQEAELRTLRAQAKATAPGKGRVFLNSANEALPDHFLFPPDLVLRAEAALKELREAKDDATRRLALGALDRALRRLREQLRRPGDTAPRPANVLEKKG